MKFPHLSIFSLSPLPFHLILCISLYLFLSPNLYLSIHPLWKNCYFSPIFCLPKDTMHEQCMCTVCLFCHMYSCLHTSSASQFKLSHFFINATWVFKELSLNSNQNHILSIIDKQSSIIEFCISCLFYVLGIFLYVFGAPLIKPWLLGAP